MKSLIRHFYELLCNLMSTCSSALDGDSSNSGSGEQRRYFEEKEKQSRQTEKQEVNPSRSRIDSDLEEQNDSKVSKSKVNEGTLTLRRIILCQKGSYR